MLVLLVFASTVFSWQPENDEHIRQGELAAKLLTVEPVGEKPTYWRTAKIVKANTLISLEVHEVNAGDGGAMRETKRIAFVNVKQVRVIPRGETFGLLIQYTGEGAINYDDSMKDVVAAFFGGLSQDDAREIARIILSIRDTSSGE